MKNICHNFYRTMIFNASALLAEQLIEVSFLLPETKKTYLAEYC